MNYNKLEYYVSQPRLNRFLIASGNSKVKAQKLYHANLKVAQSFYPVLNIDFTYATAIKKELYELLDWIDSIDNRIALANKI